MPFISPATFARNGFFSNSFDLQATQMFVILILLEFVVNTVRRHKKARVNDAVSSISAGIISQMSP